MGAIERDAGNPERARELIAESAALANEVGHAWWESGMLAELAQLDLAAGRLEAGREAALKSLAMKDEMRDRPGRVFGVGLMARAAAEAGDSERAGLLWGAIEDEDAGAPLGGWRRHRQENEERIRELAGPSVRASVCPRPRAHARRSGRARARLEKKRPTCSAPQCRGGMNVSGHSRTPGGDSMNDKPKWQVARLDEMDRRGRDIPVREQLGIHAFGINAYTPGEDGTLINDHDESGSGQEELYIVLDGNATFEVDGDTVEAPAGTFVFVAPEARRKATGDGTVLALGGTPGEAYQGIDWGEAWPFHNESMKAYDEQRYADALEAVRACPRAHAGPRGLELQLRVLRNARGRYRRRDVRPPPPVRRAVTAVPGRRAQRRRLRRRTRRPAVRGGSSVSAQVPPSTS